MRDVTAGGIVRQLESRLWLAELYAKDVLVFGIGTTRDEALEDLKAQTQRKEKEATK